MRKEFNGDYRVFRVVMASKDPIATLSAIRKGEYSIITLLDTLEMLDVQETIREEADRQARAKQANNVKRRR